MTAAKTHVPSDRQVHEPALRSKYHAAPSWLLITKSQFEGKHSDSSGKGAIGRPPEHPICDKCSRRHPAGTSRDRSNREMLSIPRKPPSKRFDPSESLRLSHQDQFMSSLVKMRTRKVVSRDPSRT